MRVQLYRKLAEKISPLFRTAKEDQLVTQHPNWRLMGSATRSIWIHGASVGELENLRQIVEQLLDEGWPEDMALVVTSFSRSALSVFSEWELALSPRIPGKFCIGLSPQEGDWKGAFEKARPHCFVTSKYESWPDLWSSLSELEIPLVITGVRPRSSLKWASRIQKMLGAGLPKLHLFIDNPSSEQELKTSFPKAFFYGYRDPRWDRVSMRLQKEVERAEALKAWIGNHKNTNSVGVFGSLWMSGLRKMRRCIDDREDLFVFVPHNVDHESTRHFENELSRMGFEVIRSTRLRSPKTNRFCLLVDEMGVLVNLYACADWAYVGGGFGKGVHSTIEPALAGIPILCGPNGIQKFEEIGRLRSWGQLRVVGEDLKSEDASDWVHEMTHSSTGKSRWSNAVSKQLGGAQEIARFIQSIPKI